MVLLEVAAVVLTALKTPAVRQARRRHFNLFTMIIG